MADFIWIIPLLVFAGIFAGLIAGGFGTGGGAVMVPVLFWCFEIIGVPQEFRMHMAVGTSLFLIIISSARSIVVHARYGAVDFSLLRLWAVPIIIGSISGGIFASLLSGRILTILFISFLMLLALWMMGGERKPILSDKMPAKPVQAAYMWVVGASSAMLGIGGGSLTIALLSLYGRSLIQAVATASGVGCFIALPSALTFMVTGMKAGIDIPYSIGYVHWLAGLCLLPGLLLGVVWGARLSHALPSHWLNRLWVFALLSVSASLIYKLLV